VLQPECAIVLRPECVPVLQPDYAGHLRRVSASGAVTMRSFRRPSAAGQITRRADPAVQGSESHDGNWLGVPGAQTRALIFCPGPSPHNVARTRAADQAFPRKKTSQNTKT
jgi:hypothetical protein